MVQSLLQSLKHLLCCAYAARDVGIVADWQIVSQLVVHRREVRSRRCAVGSISGVISGFVEAVEWIQYAIHQVYVIRRARRWTKKVNRRHPARN